MEGKWTKGDWGVRERTHVVRSVRECESLGPGIGAGVSYVPVAKAYGETEAETKANARLIAQAPAMAEEVEADRRTFADMAELASTKRLTAPQAKILLAQLAGWASERVSKLDALLTAIKGE